MKSEVKEWVGWANGSIVNPTSLAKAELNYQKDGSPTCTILFFSSSLNIYISRKTCMGDCLTTRRNPQKPVSIIQRVLIRGIPIHSIQFI